MGGICLDLDVSIFFLPFIHTTHDMLSIPVVDPGFPKGWGANFVGGNQLSMCLCFEKFVCWNEIIRTLLGTRRTSANEFQWMHLISKLSSIISICRIKKELMKTSCLRLKLVELTSFKFQCWRSEELIHISVQKRNVSFELP